ncbi:MAG: NADH-dependent alcohol dehydrogenase [Clostridiales bacterium]|nr:MAG: NADH-dependent alcohol dehydrogenase [Clostridiales bacterium]
MENFNFYAPTQVVFGKNAEAQVGELVKAQHCKKVLVHFGGNSAKKSGLLDRVCASLDKAGIQYVTLGGVVPNPRLSKVREGIELCQKEGVDFLLAVGGGSVIDSCKAIGYGLANDCDVWDLYEGKAAPTGCYPVGAVLTIAAAGSEMSNSSVITNEEGWLKMSCNTDYGRCKFAVMNPELTYTLPQYQTMSGCTDILMHTMERYFTNVETMELTDVIAEALMRNVIRNAKILMKDPENYEARAQVMWASSLAHNDLTGCGAVGDYASHQIEHELGGLFDVTHGAGLAAVWGSWARYVYKHNVNRFAQFAVNVLGVYNHFDNPERTALEGIEAMEKFYREIEMPISIKELLNGKEITDAEIDEMAEKCTRSGKKIVGHFVELKKEDIIKIYEMAR